MLNELRSQLRRELLEQRMLVESFAVFMGVLLILLPLEFGLFTWESAFIAHGGAVMRPETFLDQYIPFVPEFAWPYWMYFLLLCASVWLPNNRRELARQATGMLLIHFAGFLCFFLFPSAISRGEIGCESLSCMVTGMTYTVDPGFGVFPSLHVAMSVYMAGSFFAFNHRSKWLVAALAVAIIVATVLIKQHYVVDVPAGIFLGFAGWKLSWQLVDRFYEPLSSRGEALLSSEGNSERG